MVGFERSPEYVLTWRPLWGLHHRVPTWVLERSDRGVSTPQSHTNRDYKEEVRHILDTDITRFTNFTLSRERAGRSAIRDIHKWSPLKCISECGGSDEHRNDAKGFYTRLAAMVEKGSSTIHVWDSTIYSPSSSRYRISAIAAIRRRVPPDASRALALAMTGTYAHFTQPGFGVAWRTLFMSWTL